MTKPNRIWLAWIVLALVVGGVGAQDDPPQDPPPTTEAPTTPLSDGALDALVESINRKRRELAENRARQNLRETTAAERVELQRAGAVLRAELNKLRQSFESVATGIDVAEYEDTPAEAFDLQSELQQLVEPAIQALKDLTERSRSKQRLKSEVEEYAARETQIRQAIAKLDKLIREEKGEALLERLEETRTRWKRELSRTVNRRTVSQFKLKQIEGEEKGLWDGLKEDSDTFIKGIGFTLLLAIAAFFLMVIGMRAARRGIRRMLRRRHGNRSTYSRVFDVLYELIVFSLAIVAVLVVFLLRGDWVLLGLAVLVLLLVAWASKRFLPTFIEQIRVVLNLGTVREDERVIYNGLPWHVTRLHFYTRLTNPLLTGGLIRLPVNDLMSLHSRPRSEREEWFPSKQGDWILMPDGVRGHVVIQTPEIVQLEELGGLVHTYPAADFLAAPPANLSAGFRRSITFGIDYEFQPICTTEVPKLFTEWLDRGLKEQFDPSWIVKTNVEFASAGASSLDYEANVDFIGDAARDYSKVRRAIQRLLVDACNEYAWGIPFTQITIHQAGPPADGE